MKDRLIGFIKTYCLFVCIFVLQKPLFMLFYKSLYPDASCADWFSVIWHGLPLDLSLAGYLTAIPGFLFITSVWTLSKSLHRIWCGYFLFISVLISIYNPQIQISAESGTKRSIFRQKNKTKRSKKRLHTTLIKPEQKVNEDLCSGFIVS